MHLKRPLQHLLTSKYMLLIIFATAFYGASSIISKHVLTTVNSLQLLLIAHVFVLFNFTIFSLFKEHRINPIHHLKTFGFYGLLASVFTVAFRLTQVLAMSMAFVSLVIPIKRMSSLFATFIGGELFHEKAVLQRSVACIILIIGASLLIL